MKKLIINCFWNGNGYTFRLDTSDLDNFDFKKECSNRIPAVSIANSTNDFENYKAERNKKNKKIKIKKSIIERIVWLLTFQTMDEINKKYKLEILNSNNGKPIKII